MGEYRKLGFHLTTIILSMQFMLINIVFCVLVLVGKVGHRYWVRIRETSRREMALQGLQPQNQEPRSRIQVLVTISQTVDDAVGGPAKELGLDVKGSKPQNCVVSLYHVYTAGVLAGSVATARFGAARRPSRAKNKPKPRLAIGSDPIWTSSHKPPVDVPFWV
ncbi:hypothetical protein B0H14DRAFT_2649804 [Mycena olivaceomarginata]|nr:hypothetical protein B0H14DRAFT_2649804 [Mycena olivaceomarginata]